MLNESVLPKHVGISVGIGIIIILTLFIFFPGGYSLEEINDNKVTISKNGLLQSEAFTVEVTTENELRIALFRNVINKWKEIVLIIYIFIPVVLIILAVNFVSKSKEEFTIMCVLSVLLIAAAIYLYVNSVQLMDQLVMKLKI